MTSTSLRIYKKKINIKQGDRDYNKFMAILKEMKSNAQKEVCDSIDQRLSMMIIEYGKNLQRAGINITASEGGNNVVNINNNEDNDDNNNNYIGLDIVSISVGV